MNLLDESEVAKILVALIILTTVFMMQPLNAHDIGAKNVIITNEYVSSDSRCSCIQGDWYSYKQGMFVNYCPGCHNYGSLEYECNGEGWSDYARSDEGMWYCGVCDRDFCSQCGFTHGSYNSGNWLTPYEIPEEVVPVVQAVDNKTLVLGQFKEFVNTIP